jgi:hypothetical protein
VGPYGRDQIYPRLKDVNLSTGMIADPRKPPRAINAQVHIASDAALGGLSLCSHSGRKTASSGECTCPVRAVASEELHCDWKHRHNGGALSQLAKQDD